MNWLDELIKEHSEFESPMSFWWWGALASISAITKDNIWMDRYLYKLYPNIYVMLHADSGLKKGPPIAMARKLANAVGGVKVITGRSSVQGILKEMGTTQLRPEDKGRVSQKSNVFVCSSELTSSLVDDPVATKILTDLFDRSYNEGEWKSLLKMEQFTLVDPTISMFTATNDSMSEDFFTKSAVRGGYMARTFMIYESKRNRKNSLAYPPEHLPDYKKYTEYLRKIANLRGPFKPFALLEPRDEYQHRRVIDGRNLYFSTAGAIYEDWYSQFIDLIDNLENKDETGTLNRFGDSVLKVAMLLALAEKPELEISELAMTKAITTCEKLLGNVRRTTHGKQGLSNTAALKTMIINELFQRETHKVTREVLMKKMWTHYADAMEFDNIMQSFDAAGLIKTASIGNVITYEMLPAQVEELKKYFEGKSRK
jgi:hypothetical protein